VGGAGGDAEEESCDVSTGEPGESVLVLAYGGGGDRGMETGTRERVKELDSVGRLFLSMLNARARIEFDVGCTTCVEYGARMNCVTWEDGFPSLRGGFFEISSSFASTNFGDGGCTTRAGGVGGYEWTLDILGRSLRVTSGSGARGILVREVKDKAASAYCGDVLGTGIKGMNTPVANVGERIRMYHPRLGR